MLMNKLLQLIFGSILALTIVSCAYNKDELPTPGDGNSPVYTGPIITYNSHIKAYFDNDCISCHSSPGASAGVDLTTYSGSQRVQDQAAGGRILARVINGSPSFMPQAGSLPQTTLDTIQFWLDQGYPQ